MSGLRYGDRAIRRERDPENPGPPLPKEPPPAPPPTFDVLRNNVEQANLVYAQLTAERMEAERMEGEALAHLKRAQEAFDAAVAGFRGLFPQASLWGR